MLHTYQFTNRMRPAHNIVHCDECGSEWYWSSTTKFTGYYPNGNVCEKCVNGPNPGKNKILIEDGFGAQYTGYDDGDEHDEIITATREKYI